MSGKKVIYQEQSCLEQVINAQERSLNLGWCVEEQNRLAVN